MRLRTGKLGGLVTFGFLTIVCGLLQLWVLSLILLAQGKTITFSTLLGDGGLFFFATSLAFTSLTSLSSRLPLVFGSAPLNVTLILVFPTACTAVVVYSSVLSGSSGGQPYPFSGHLTSQVSCAFASIVYAFFVFAATGALVDSDDNQPDQSVHESSQDQSAKPA